MDIFGELSLFRMFLKINQNMLTQAKYLIKCPPFERSEMYYPTLGLTGTLRGYVGGQLPGLEKPFPYLYGMGFNVKLGQICFTILT